MAKNSKNSKVDNKESITPQQQLQTLVQQALQQSIASLMQQTFSTMHTLCDKVASKSIIDSMTDKQLSQIITVCDKELEKRSKAQEKARSKRSKNK